MRETKDIREYKQHYKKLYSAVRDIQKEDQSYRDDTFPVPEIRDPHRVWRSGMGKDMVDSPAEQIVTSNPQAFFEIRKGDKDASIRFSKEVNQDWIDILRRQNPNPFKESVKNKLGRGESFIHPIHNELWVTGNKERKGLPVLFLIPDPMVVYASPQEDENGIPEIVIILYQRQPKDLIVKYPSWTNPKKAGTGDNKDATVEWFEFWDKNTMHFEADEEVVVHQDNPYGFTPFVRKYSGFGRRSPEGKLEDLIVSNIRTRKDLIKQECIKRSNIYSVEDIFSHRPRTIVSPGEINKNELEKLTWGSYDLNVLQNVPAGTEIIKDDYPSVPNEMYMSHANLKAEIAQREPFTTAGWPMGSSGRQQDITFIAAMRRYDTVVENTENEWATAFEMALKICQVIPTLKPEGLHKRDLASVYKCQVKLKAEDPTEQDRLATLGDRLWAGGQGSIDLRTNLVRYQGYTEDEAEDIIANILVDRLTLYNPDVASVMGMVFAEESGMERWIEQAKQRQAEMAQQGGMTKELPPTGMERIKGESAGLEVAGSMGAKRPPERYTR